MQSKQLVLNVGLPDLASFDNFFAGSNQETVEQINSAAVGRPGLVFIHGPSGCGKTHLLYASIRAAKEIQRSSIYLSRALVEGDQTQWMDLPGEGLICIDDIKDSLTTKEAVALFSLFERIKEKAGTLLLASRHSALQINWALTDLKSRIQSDLSYRVKTLAENELIKALELRAEARGFSLGEEVLRYVLRRYDRNPKSLFALLDKIDAESLARQRLVTIPLIQSLENQN